MTASWIPRAAARWITRCASKVLERSETSRWKSRPSPAAAAVTLPIAASAWARDMAYFDASTSAWSGPSPAARTDVACGSSSKLRHSTSTWSACAKRPSGRLEPPLADVAPRTDDVRPDLDLHTCSFNGCLPANPTEPAVVPRPADPLGRVQALADHLLHDPAQPVRAEAGRHPGHPRDDLVLTGPVPAGVAGHRLEPLDGGGERGPLGEQRGQPVVEGVHPAAHPGQRGRVGPGQLDVRRALLVLRPVAATYLAEAVAGVERLRPRVGLEDVEAEAAGTQALREVEQRRAHPGAGVPRRDVQGLHPVGLQDQQPERPGGAVVALGQPHLGLRRAPRGRPATGGPGRRRARSRGIAGTAAARAAT